MRSEMGYCMYILNIISQLTYIPVLLLHQGTTVAWAIWGAHRLTVIENFANSQVT